MKFTDNNWLLMMTIDDMKFTETKIKKKVKKILWIQIIVVSLYWEKENKPITKV